MPAILVKSKVALNMKRQPCEEFLALCLNKAAVINCMQNQLVNLCWVETTHLSDWIRHLAKAESRRCFSFHEYLDTLLFE